jgi:hypothetical protein
MHWYLAAVDNPKVFSLLSMSEQDGVPWEGLSGEVFRHNAQFFMLKATEGN